MKEKWRRKMDYKTSQELIQIIEEQGNLINKHLELISNLINENLEKENFICELTKEVSDHET